MPLRLVFMGTPDFAVATLAALIGAGHNVVCAYSQPPRPAGRGYGLKKSPVHQYAEDHHIEVRTPASLKSEAEQQRFAELGADAAVVVAYGLILPMAVLAAPRLGCFNVHASLLPRWRGAAPIQRAIMAGDAETGVCIMKMDQGLDTGPVVKIVKTAIRKDATAQNLHDELARLGAQAMIGVLADPTTQATPQPSEGVTYASKISKDEARIDFTQSADQVRNQIHGLSPFPGAWFILNGARVKILRCRVADGTGEAGTCLDDHLTIACGHRSIQCIELQREGKSPMPVDEFLRGLPVPAGTKAG